MRPEGELWRIQAQAGLSVVAITAVDIFFHFFYILTIPSDLKFANRLPDSALGGSPHQGWGQSLRPTLCSPWHHEAHKGAGMGAYSLKGLRLDLSLVP